MFTYRHRIAAPPPPQPSMVHIPPSFVSIPNRQFLSHMNVPTQDFPSKTINFHPHNKSSSFNHLIEKNYFGFPAVYGFPGELDFRYTTSSVGNYSYPFATPDYGYGPLQRTWQDLDTRKDHDVSTEFFQQNDTKSESGNGFSHRNTLPTDETFLSPYESDSESDLPSSSSDNDEQPRPNGDRRSNAQDDSDAASSDEFSDESSEYYDSDSNDEWTFPPRGGGFTNSSMPFGLSLKEAVLSYEQRWTAMLTHRCNNHGQLVFESVPWPQYPPPRSPAEINQRSIREFLRTAGGSSRFMLKTIFRQTMLRFHPDKSAVLLAHVDERQRRLVFEGCTAVARCLNDIKDLF